MPVDGDVTPTPRSSDPGSVDIDLLERARGGDPTALDAILREHAAQIEGVCRRLCQGRDDAQDATQEALLAVARGLSSFDGRSSLSTWVYRVTTNACFDELRRQRRRPVPVDDATRTELASSDPAPADAAVAAEERARLRVALDSLPEDFRIAVVLRDVADLDYGAISEIIGVPIGTVRSRIARGRGRLADALSEGPGTEPTTEPSDSPEMT